MIAKTRGSTSEFVRMKLLKDIQDGCFLPSERLTTEGLAKRYQVSRTPVREALIQLSQNGLVDATANSGYELHRATVPELCEIYEIREALEGIAVAKLIESGPEPGVIKELRGYCEARRNAANMLEANIADRKFHLAICHHCGSAMIPDLVNNYLVLSTTFNLTPPLLVDDYVHDRKVNTEHDAIVDAIEAGKGKLAQKLLGAHIAFARRELEKLIGKKTSPAGKKVRSYVTQ